MSEIVTNTLGSIDLSAAGGLLLLLDMVFFSLLAANWDLAGRVRLRRANLPPRR